MPGFGELFYKNACKLAKYGMESLIYVTDKSLIYKNKGIAIWIILQIFMNLTDMTRKMYRSAKVDKLAMSTILPQFTRNICGEHFNTR